MGGGHTEGAAYIYIGGDSKIGNASHPRTINSTVGGNVFGAGRGNSGHIASIVDSYIVVADDAEVLHDVYGGGNYGHNTHQANIYIVGGTVKGKVFGGANQKQGAQVDIHMTGGTVIGGVYGGSNSSGIVTGPVNVNIVGGTVGEDGQDAEHGHVFGSGYGEGSSVTGDVLVTIGAANSSHSDFPLIYGNVYGGGHAAPYNSTGKTFQVIGQNGLVKGSIFGGGMDGEVRGNSFVIIKD